MSELSAPVFRIRKVLGANLGYQTSSPAQACSGYPSQKNFRHITVYFKLEHHHFLVISYSLRPIIAPVVGTDRTVERKHIKLIN